MENNKDRLYEYFVSYMDEFHEKNKRRLRKSVIVLILLPVVLGLIRWLTDSDKTVFLIIWVLCMFVLAVYLVSIDYYDHILYRRIRAMTDGEELPGILEAEDVLPPKVVERVRDRIGAAGAEADAGRIADAPGIGEEGGGE